MSNNVWFTSDNHHNKFATAFWVDKNGSMIQLVVSSILKNACLGGRMGND